MSTLRRLFFAMAMMLLWVQIHGQSAAEQKISAKYSSDQIADIQTHTPYKYQGLLLFYTDSWLVSDQGQLRAPNDQEILAIDLDQYTPQRSETSRVTVQDATLGTEIVLLGRQEFEATYLTRLNPTDKQAYLAYKSLFTTAAQKAAQ